MSHTYEVEIKSLLGSKENADKLISSLQKKFPDTKLVGEGKQLNHYFNSPKDLSVFATSISHLIPRDKKDSFDKIIKEGKKISIRTRDADGKVILVFKASVGDDTSANGVKRIEFETFVDMNLASLDKSLIDAGCSYQAKWSRERREYRSGDMNVCIDRNAGYGYLAEFEKITQDETSLNIVRDDLLKIMTSLGVQELKQDRLERMFDFYNKNWSDYYGTDKTFLIE
jgi:predicted adenylyl cyclase CyaB